MRALAFLVLCACGAHTSAAARLDAALRADAAHGFTGAVLVARGDALVLDAAYGATVATTSRFWIASAGKQFTAAAILACAERGWLSVDDPLSRWFSDAPADKRAITIRQLLSHTAGLDQTYASEGAADRDAAVARMLAAPVVDAPGAAFHYSNDDDQLAAAIVELASHAAYQDFVRTLFARAGLTDTGFAGDPGAARVVAGRRPRPARLDTPGWGAQGVYSTTHDLFRWYRALRAGRVLAPAGVAAMFTPVAPIHEGEAALGWFAGPTAAGPAIFVRGNEDWGPNALLYAYPARDEIIVVLTHAGDADADHSWSRLVLSQLEPLLP